MRGLLAPLTSLRRAAAAATGMGVVMRFALTGPLVAATMLGAVAEAQTVAGRIPAVWDAELGVYAYGPLYWDIDVAPDTAAADEFSMYLYYNKREAFMSVELACRAPGETFDKYARSYSGDHFLSLTTGLLPGNECVLFLVGASDKEEELAFRMVVSENVTRPTSARELSSAQSSRFSGQGAQPPDVSATLRRLARAVADHR